MSIELDVIKANHFSIEIKINKMTSEQNFWENNDIGVLIMRVSLGVLILFHGWHKVVHGIDMPMARMESWGFPGFLMYFAYISEVLAPLLLIAGIFCRLSTLAIFLTMTTVMYIELKTGIGLDRFGAPTIEGQLFYWFFSAALFFTGSGRYCLIDNSNKHWLLK